MRAMKLYLENHRVVCSELTEGKCREKKVVRRGVLEQHRGEGQYARRTTRNYASIIND